MGLCHSTIERTSGKDSGVSSAGATAAETAAERQGSLRWRRPRDLNVGGENDGIHQVVGRFVSNSSSEIACLYTQQGKKGTNQDAMLVWENFCSRNDTVFCGVFDGHGPFGHMVAKKVRDTLPFILSTHWKMNLESEHTILGNGHEKPCTEGGQGNEPITMDEQWCELQPGDGESEKFPEMYLPLKHALLKACQQMDKELKMHPAIDCFCSGSTAVTLIKQGKDLVVGNVGDSRAVLATRDQDNSLIAVQLTVDLKPDLPNEAARIQKCKGRVFALQDEPEVARVWLPNSDSPGLAMARAFGDFCLKDYGLISVPDVYYRCLGERDQFVILATDGVWDVLSNKEAVDIVASAPTRATAARAVVDTAVRAWRVKYPTSKNDDCAVVCLFLEDSSTAMEVSQTGKCSHEESAEIPTVKNDDHEKTEAVETKGDSQEPRTSPDTDEIVPVIEVKEEKMRESCRMESKRTLAECISGGDDEEWSALEGLTRVNSLLSIPRFLSGELRSLSWRKWL
ncbi:PREDICTED: probable protein phosphatase 2C 6 [Tarenaya hassleriana]|uniref:probable protein phosphatase 2C 6 n=1 Tax=Tarenaya hassleriana TaxID=28532 RepID=UPI00053C4C7C|nr:PREDICTED: probable protein phosphatase 2C 6 [Tarenaya hassleriana]